MIKEVINKLKSSIFPKRIAAIQIFITREGAEGSAILMESKEGDLQINEKLGFQEDWTLLLKRIPKSYPVILTINGKGILHKNSPKGQDIIQIANQLFPNIRQADFYFQQTDMVNGAIVSLIKNDVIEAFQNSINEEHLQLIGFSLGAFGLAKLHLLDASFQSFQGLHQELIIDEKGQILTFSNSSTIVPDTTFQFGDLFVHQNELVEFSTGFNYLMEAFSDIEFSNYEEQIKEYQYGQLFRTIAPVTLGLLFFVMLLNTFLFYRWKDNTELNQSAIVSTQQKLDEVKDKKSSLTLQKKIFRETGANKVSSASYYADRIGANLPKELKLIELDIFPAEGKKSNRRKKDLIKFQNDQIRAKGVCKNSKTYNLWLKELESEDWIASVKHENYRDINNKSSEFVLTIELADLKEQ